MSESWFKNAIIYAVDVKKFLDSDGDGIGDFPGLTRQLDYLSGLGVTCIWLLPFYPTPSRDDGYDVSDYYGVDPRLGTLGDFVNFMREARERGIHVIADLVVNHTSDQHPWFQVARRDRTSRYREFYVWTDRPPELERRGAPVFPGEESSNWTYDPVAGAYYWHWFYDHQPDLNIGNPEVAEEIKKVMGFWLEMGLSGFRVDAATFLVGRKGLTGAHPEDPSRFLAGLRSFLNTRSTEAVLLAEADVDADTLPLYLGEGDRMHLLFNFILNNYLFLSLARQSAEPLIRGLGTLPVLPQGCQWANFVRNHDELNLDKLTPEEREEVFAAFAPEPSMRIYSRGIRRRLPPMLGGDRRHWEMVYSLLFSLPGTPVLRYGQEIGMGDDLSLAGRMSVRTPMQWSAGANAGFSAAPADALIAPLVTGGPYGYEQVNLDAQRRDSGSQLNFILRLIRTRKECPEFGSGALTVLDAGDPAVLMHACEWNGRKALAIHNLAREPRIAHLSREPGDGGEMVDLLGDRLYDAIGSGSSDIRLEGFGYRWLRCL